MLTTLLLVAILYGLYRIYENTLPPKP